MKSASRPVITALRGRLYSAQAAPKASPATEQFKVSRLPSGAVVASLENNSPVSRVAVLYNAGSRYETPGDEGISHCVRSLANLSTQHATGFGTTRTIQQLGGSFAVSTTREHMVYELDVLRDHLPEGVEALGNACRDPAYKAWEVKDAVPKLQLDLALFGHQQEARVMEALHSAAYHDTLGNCLYMPKHKVGAISPAHLQAWTNTHLCAANMAIVGTGMDHDELVKLVKNSVAPGKSADGANVTPKAAHYYGGQWRLPSDSGIVHAAVVTQGASLSSKDMIPLAVLQHLLGTGPSVKYSNNASSRAMQAVAKATTNPCVASCINLNYSDSGLFGFYAAYHAKDGDKVLRALIAEFSGATKAAVSDADLNRAKTQLKARIHYELECGNSQVIDAISQLALTGEVLDQAAIDATINSVTAADVQAVQSAIAKKFINGKPTMAVVGDLAYTPHLDQLFNRA